MLDDGFIFFHLHIVGFFLLLLLIILLNIFFQVSFVKCGWASGKDISNAVVIKLTQ